MEMKIYSEEAKEGPRVKFRKNKHISLFGRYNIKFEKFSKNIQYTDLGTATLISQAIVE
jgi:hypothetical protein